MDLIKITYILIVSLVASFLIRTTGTLFPHIFQNTYVVKVTIPKWLNALLTLLYMEEIACLQLLNFPFGVSFLFILKKRIGDPDDYQ